MSKAAFWQRGESLDFTNATTDMIEANTVMTLGSRICVAGTDILPGETGSIHVAGGFAFPKRKAESRRDLPFPGRQLMTIRFW